MSRFPGRFRLKGPEADLEAAVRSAEVVHIHGLWQGHTRRGARTARAAARPLPDRGPRHGRALGPAAQEVEESASTWHLSSPGTCAGRPACTPCRGPRSATCASSPPGRRSASSPTASTSIRSTTCPLAPSWNKIIPSSKASSCCSSSAGSTSRKGSTSWPRPWAGSLPTFPELHLLIAGNDDGAWSPFADRIAELGLTGRVTYLGHVAGERARAVWAAADAFILPSYSEGFSMAILEALACSLPCLITTACHFPELADAEGAIVVEPEKNAVTQGLRELLEKSPRSDNGWEPTAGGSSTSITLGTNRPTVGVRLPMARRRRTLPPA